MTRARVRSLVEWVHIAFQCAGFVVFLFFLLGFFEHEDRVRLYEQLRAGDDVPAASAPALELLAYLEVPQDSRSAIAKISRLDPPWNGLREDKVTAIHHDGHIDVIGDMSEVQSWAEQKPWLYLSLIAVFMAVGIAIAFILKLLPLPDPPSVLETQVFS